MDRESSNRFFFPCLEFFKYIYKFQVRHIFVYVNKPGQKSAVHLCLMNKFGTLNLMDDKSLSFWYLKTDKEIVIVAGIEK